jgi:hypothetical protein
LNIFLKDYETGLVLDVHAPLVLNFLVSLFEEENNIKMKTLPNF